MRTQEGANRVYAACRLAGQGQLKTAAQMYAIGYTIEQCHQAAVAYRDLEEHSCPRREAKA
jgi:hypothetical protein